jgi:DNA-binding transcriptional ArsR family regulator
MAYQSALAAPADPTRRRVLERLRSAPLAVGDIARRMPVSRPAVSQHLKVLKEAGLVADRPEGARRVYYIDPKGAARDPGIADGKPGPPERSIAPARAAPRALLDDGVGDYEYFRFLIS